MEWERSPWGALASALSGLGFPLWYFWLLDVGCGSYSLLYSRTVNREQIPAEYLASSTMVCDRGPTLGGTI